MGHRKLTYALFLLLVCGWSLCRAQTLPVRNYSKAAYQAGGQNWDITQGPSGILYFANDNGILDFDSSEWSLRQNPEGISTRTLCFDTSSGSLYFGRYNVLRRLSLNDNHLPEEEVILDGTNSNIGEIWQIEIGEDGVFFRDEWNVYRYGKSGVHTFHFPGKVDVLSTIGNSIVIYARDKGLMVYRNKQFERLGEDCPFAGRKVCSLLPLGDAILVVTENDGLWRYDAGRFERVATPFERDLREQIIFCAATDGERIALGTVSSGVFLFDLVGGETFHLDSTHGLQNNTVLCLFFDRAGDLWLGLDRGIDQILLSAPEQPLLPPIYDIGAGYASEFFEGKLYLGTNQGLFCRDNAGTVTPVDGVKGQVWNLVKIDGSLFCCMDQGLYIFTPGRPKRHIPLNGVWNLLPLEKHPGIILGACYDRMFTMERGSGKGDFRFIDFVEGFDDSSRVFEEDSDGRIWLSHWQKGLFRLLLSADARHFSQVERFSSANGFPTDHNNIPNKVSGRIVFTSDRGFYRYDALSLSAVPADEFNTMFKLMPPALRVFELQDGIRYYTSGNKQIIEYPDGNGEMLRDTSTFAYLCKKRKLGFDHIRALSPDKILINTEEGFSILRLDRLKEKKDRKGFAPLIRHVYLTGPAGDSLVFSSVRQSADTAPLMLDYRHNSLRFEYVCPQFETDSPWNQASYLLENYDNGWITPSAGNTKEYTRLAPGKYVFRIQNAYGQDNLPVWVSYPWFLTPLAYLAYALLLLAFVWLLERFLNARARKKTRQAEEERRKEQMKLDLTEKANDLAASTMEVLHKNEVIRKINNSLDELSPYLEGNSKGEELLESLRVTIREGVGNDDVWKRFQSNFDIVHSGFLSLLQERYPGLNHTERRICVYLKMGLRTKEIAPLLNMTPRSIEMTRHRIRKKLGVSRSDNLVYLLDHLS